MKITKVEAIHLRLPDVNERCDGSQETLVVKVHTDDGVVGLGEADSSSHAARAVIEAPVSHKICRGLAECVPMTGNRYRVSVCRNAPLELDEAVVAKYRVA